MKMKLGIHLSSLMLPQKIVDRINASSSTKLHWITYLGDMPPIETSKSKTHMVNNNNQILLFF